MCNHRLLAHRRAAILSLAVGLFAWLPRTAPAGEARAAVGELASPAGTLLVREKQGKPWQAPKHGALLRAEDLLLALPGGRAEIDVGPKGMLRLTLFGSLPELSGSPVFESAVVLHPRGQHDLNVTLDRGRLLLTNRKDKGSVRAQVRFRDQRWELDLLDPGTLVALELYSRWTRTEPFLQKPDAAAGLTSGLVLTVLKGQVDVKYGGEQHVLERGSLLEWGSDRGVVGPLALKHFPDWFAAPPSGTAAKEARKAVEQLSAELKTKPVEATVRAALKNANGAARSQAACSLGALDDLPGLLATLADPQHGDVRRAAVLGLRHWAGRDAGHEKQLYEALGKAGYRANQAAIVMQLLHGFFEKQLGQPETYESLINLLQSDQLAIRELAGWHLNRLVPQGRAIAYDAAGSADQRAKAQGAWRKLIPEGKLPGQK
jgi:hypothetical protein